MLAIPKLSPHAGYLCLGLGRNYLSEYEKQELKFVCAELSIVLRAQEHARQQLEDIVQIRHAIRAGLTGVVGQVEVAWSYYQLLKPQDTPGPNYDSSGLRKALQRAQSFSKKTQTILEESRFLLGNFKRGNLKLHVHSPAALIREIVQGLKDIANRRGLTLNLVNAPETQSEAVQFDRDLMDMVIFNLLDNAIKYSHREKEVLIQCYFEKGEWCLEVTDRGVYIPPEDREVIFEKFTRRPTGRAAATRPGTGLGLAVAKEIVEVHGGSIQVDSRRLHADPEAAAETTFTLRMPRRIPTRDE